MSNQALQISSLTVFAAALIGLGGAILMRRRDTPEKLECKRRLAVNLKGRLADGMVNDLGPDVIYYSYSVAGVEYRASQDVTHLKEFLPADPDRMIGPVTLKYSGRNPANSIVLCEAWSGLRTAKREWVSQ